MKTSYVPFFLLSVSMCMLAHAESSSVTPLNASVERARITSQRTKFETIFVQTQQACYQRFAVSDCLKQARRERRDALDGLRRQEVELNDLDRQAKAQAKLDRLQSNFSPEHQQALERQRQQAQLNSQERQMRSDSKKTASAIPAAIVRSPTSAAVRSDEDRNEVQRYTEKLRVAQQHKADKVKSVSEKGQGTAVPLAIPVDQ